MVRKWIRRAAAAGALIATLALAAPAQAAGWARSAPWAPGADGWQTVWSWIARLWPASPAPARPVEPGAPGLAKRGSDIDPNGTADASTTTPCQTNCERGSSIDPDG